MNIIKKEDLEKYATPHFKFKELCCPCCGLFNMPDEMLQFIEAVRNDFGFSMKINSGVRCAAHNASLKDSSPKSPHLEGLAIDVKCTSNVLRAKLITIAIAHGCRRIGIGRSYLHLDIKKTPTESFWLYI